MGPAQIPALPPTRQELFDLYRIAVEEYRFEAKLNADRTRLYLVLNAAILSAGTGLLKIGAATATNFFVALVFIAGAFTSYLGVRAIKQGRKYYHHAVYKKTLCEEVLGLHHPVDQHLESTLAINTTVGHSEVQAMLADPQAWMNRGTRKSTIYGMSISVLWLLAAADAAGGAASLFQAISALW